MLTIFSRCLPVLSLPLSWVLGWCGPAIALDPPVADALTVLSRSDPSITSVPIAPTLIAQAVSPRSQSIPWDRQARDRYAAGDWAAAADLWHQAAATASHPLQRALALANQALAQQQGGQWDAARTAIAASLALSEAQPASADRDRVWAQGLEIRGQLDRSTGRAEAAIAAWDQAAALYQRVDRPDAAIRVQLQQIRALQDLGLYPRACDRLLTLLAVPAAAHCQPEIEDLAALATAEPRLPPDLELPALTLLATVLQLMGEGERAVATVAAATTIATQRGTGADRAAIALTQGNIARLQWERLLPTDARRAELGARAQAAYATALNQAQTADRADLVRQAQLQILALAIAARPTGTDLPASASALARTLSAELATLPPGGDRLTGQLALARTALETFGPRNSDLEPGAGGDRPATLLTPAEVVALLQDAEAQAIAIHHPQAAAEALAGRGQLAEFQGQLDPGAQFTQAALAQVATLDAPEVTYRLMWQLGRIEGARGQREAALSAYDQAIQILQSLRVDLATASADAQFSFRDRVEPVYREFVDLLLDPAITPDHATLSRARDVIEALQLAEIDNFFNDACSATQPAPADAIDPAAAVIYTIVLPDRLELVMAFADGGFERQSVPVSEATLGRVVTQVRGAITGYRTLPVSTAQQALQQLDGWLLQPLEPTLQARGVKTLVFVLDGTLRTVPMAALYDGQAYAIERYQIALTPGLNLLDPRPLNVQDTPVLGAGLSESRFNWDPLPAVPQELGSIATQLPTETLLNDQFTRTTLQNTATANPFRIVHLATHGNFGSSAEDTYVLAWDGPIGAQDFDQLLQTEDQQGTPVELLVLSACQTAAGDDRAALGLAGIAVRAGARSTVASLWRVNDASTQQLMAAFYRVLGESEISKAAALRQAQLELLHSESFSHPYFWSAFVLLGNWL